MNALYPQALCLCGLTALVTVGCDSTSTQSAADRRGPSVSSDRISHEDSAKVGSDATSSDGPASAYQKYNNALIDGDYHIVYEWLAPNSRAAFVLVAGDMATRRIDYDDKLSREALDQLAKKYGAPTSAMGFYLRRDALNDEQLAEAIRKAYEEIDNPRAYLKSVSQTLAKAKQDPSDALSYEDDRKETVIDVQINGDSAHGQIVESPDDAGSPVEFVRHDSHWGVLSDYRIGRRD